VIGTRAIDAIPAGKELRWVDLGEQEKTIFL
jgi:hypothetical protein